MKFVVNNQLIIIYREEDFVISHLSSFRYIKADENVLETYFQALKIANATFVEMKNPVRKASSSFASLKSAKSTIEVGALKVGVNSLMFVRKRIFRFGICAFCCGGSLVLTKDKLEPSMKSFSVESLSMEIKLV